MDESTLDLCGQKQPPDLDIRVKQNRVGWLVLLVSPPTCSAQVRAFLIQMRHALMPNNTGLVTILVPSVTSKDLHAVILYGW